MKYLYKKNTFLIALILAAVVAVFSGHFLLSDNFGAEYCDWSSNYGNWSSQGNPCAIRWKPLLTVVALNWLALSAIFYLLLSSMIFIFKFIFKFFKC